MNYTVTLFDGKQFSVPQPVGEAILEAKSQFIKWGQRMLNIKSIANIEPETEKNDFFQLPGTINETLGSFNPSRRKRALESMRRGFLKHFEGREMPLNAKAMLKEMESRIATAEQRS